MSHPLRYYKTSPEAIRLAVMRYVRFLMGGDGGRLYLLYLQGLADAVARSSFATERTALMMLR